MARQPRFEYPGAIYHVMARGNGGDEVFVTDDDQKAFLFRLGQVCSSHGWKVHAWVLMGNHFHLLLETPQANLVTGMKLLLATFSQGWNRARQRRGHVFQGRYKAVPVNGTDADTHYFKALADYIHLNPARAGLAGGGRGPLVSYPWSSLPSHLKGNGPDWLVSGRILRAFNLADDGRGRRAYVAWLEARAANDGGKSTRRRRRRSAAAGISARKRSRRSCSRCWIARPRIGPVALAGRREPTGTAVKKRH
jgi:putative transposase